MPVTITTNIPKIKLKVDGAWKKTLAPLAEQALTDCNYYVRQDTGALRSSSLSASIPREGLLIWNTPYAKRVYYTGSPSKEVNPNASLMWCEKAHAERGRDWQALAQKLFNSKLEG
jgi:hypothetical protein